MDIIRTAEEFINDALKDERINTNLISDGYHTFGELYEHRIQLWISFCKITAEGLKLTRHVDQSFVTVDWENEFPWRTIKHSDGEYAFGGGWFVLGIGRKSGSQMTYHLPMQYWEQCDFANLIEKAPEFDGHTSADVLQRLQSL